MTKKYMTVVIEYEDGSMWPALLSEAMAKGKVDGKTRVTAMDTKNDLISILDEIKNEVYGTPTNTDILEDILRKIK